MKMVLWLSLQDVLRLEECCSLVILIHSLALTQVTDENTRVFVIEVFSGCVRHQRIAKVCIYVLNLHRQLGHLTGKFGNCAPEISKI